MKKIAYLLLLFFLISIAVFFLHSLYTKTSVFADAKFYYSYTRSLIFDHDLLLGNEFYKLGVIKNLPTNFFAPIFYPPGVSILWLPLFYIAYGLTNLIKLLFPNMEISGYETIFEYACGITNIILGITGLYIIYKTWFKTFSTKIILTCLIALFSATNLFFYTAIEPINSHSASFFVSALFVYIFFSKLRKNISQYFILGIIGGFSGVIRTQDLLLLTMPIVEITLNHAKNLKLFARSFFLIITGVFIGFLPQMLLWKYFYNTFWYSPYFEVGFNFINPKIFHVLFNSQNGLFLTTPITFVSFVFLAIGSLKSTKMILRYALFYFLLQLYIVSSWNEYYQGGSYSIRMMLTTYPMLTLGLGNFIQTSFKKFGSKITLLAVSGFVVLNFITILIYLLKF